MWYRLAWIILASVNESVRASLYYWYRSVRSTDPGGVGQGARHVREIAPHVLREDLSYVLERAFLLPVVHY